MISGIITALISPFKDKAIDEDSLKSLVNQQMALGVRAFVVNGTTAESPNLVKEEVINAFKCVKAASQSKAQLILGTGSNSTAKTIEMTKLAEELGADASLVVVPYYNKPTQEGLFKHYKAVAECSSQKIILYNVPGRTITKLETETIFKLQELENIIGIKEASADLEFDKEILKNSKPSWTYLSGDDATTLDFVGLGGHGAISVLSHLIADKMIEAFEAVGTSGLVAAKQEFKKYEPLIKLMFSEPNPTPVKYALYKMGVITSDEVRLPLVSATKELKTQIDKELARLGLLK